MSFDNRRKKLTIVTCRSGKKKGQILCQLCADAESSTITFYMQLSRNSTAQILFFSYCRTKSLSSYITECETAASHQGLALGEPTGKTMQTVIRILFSPILGINNLFIVHVYTNNKMLSCILVTKDDTVAVLL